MPEKKIKINLPTLDNIFSTQEDRENQNTNKIISLICDEIDDLKDHPFQVKEDRNFNLLFESIKEFGLLEAIHVRIKGDGRYEVFSGHRRKYAYEKLNIEKIPTIIHDISYDKAIILMAHANLTNRENILISERAFTYKMMFESLERQGFRSDLGTSGTIDPKLKRTRDIIAEQLSTEDNKISGESIDKYRRLTKLIPEILDMVDNGKMGFTPAYHIAYIEDDAFQKLFYNVVLELDKYPSIAQAKHIRENYTSFDEYALNDFLSEEKANEKEYFKVPLELRQKHFTRDMEDEKVYNLIDKACDFYKKYAKYYPEFKKLKEKEKSKTER